MRKAIKIFIESQSQKSQIMISKHHDMIHINKVNQDGLVFDRIAVINADTLRMVCDY